MPRSVVVRLVPQVGLVVLLLEGRVLVDHLVRLVPLLAPVVLEGLGVPVAFLDLQRDQLVQLEAVLVTPRLGVGVSEALPLEVLGLVKPPEVEGLVKLELEELDSGKHLLV